MGEDSDNIPRLLDLIEGTLHSDDLEWLQECLRGSLPKPQAAVLMIGTSFGEMNDHVLLRHRCARLSLHQSIVCLTLDEEELRPFGDLSLRLDVSSPILIGPSFHQERELASLLERLDLEMMRDQHPNREVVIDFHATPDLTGLLPSDGKRSRYFKRPENHRKPIPPTLPFKTHRRLQSFRKG